MAGPPHCGGRPASTPARALALTLEELVDETGVAPDLIKDLEDWRLVQPGKVEGTKVYDDTDREIVKACSELARFGVGGRNLKVLRTTADRQAVLLEAVVGPRASILEPQRPPRGDGEPGEPRRRLQQPHPHAARPRPAEADRRGVRPQPMARVVRRRRIAAPASALWAVITDPYHLPRWWPNTQRVENVSEGEPGERSWTQVLGDARTGAESGRTTTASR